MGYTHCIYFKLTGSRSLPRNVRGQKKRKFPFSPILVVVSAGAIYISEITVFVFVVHGNSIVEKLNRYDG